MSPRLLFVLALLAAGCGASSIQISRDEFERLPREYRQEIFDAENDVVIARNRLDEARDKRTSAVQTVSQTASKWRLLRERLAAAGQGAKLPKLQKVFDARDVYTTALIDVGSATIRRAEAETQLARARLDVVKQRQLARIGLATVASLAPLENTVKGLEAKVRAASTAEVDLRAGVQPRLSAWKSAEDDYVASFGDYDTGVWGE